MPSSCCAYNCNNRFGKLKEDGSRLQFHQFPLKNPELLLKWITAVRRKSWQPTNFTRLCGEHFVDNDYVSSSTKKYLKGNAVPTKFKFPDQPKEIMKQKRIKRPLLPFLNSMPNYLPIVISRTESIVCQLGEDEENLNTPLIQSLADHEKYIEKNSINCIDDILRHVTNFKEKKECWAMFKKDEKLAVCCMKTDSECPSVSACLLVEQNLEFTVYLNNMKINENKLPHKGKIVNKQKLEDLLTWIEASKSGDENNLLDTIISLIKSIPNYKESEDLQFITEQIKLSF